MENLSREQLVEKCKSLKEKRKEYEEIICRWGLMVSDSPEDVFSVHSAISVIEKHAQEVGCAIR